MTVAPGRRICGITGKRDWGGWRFAGTIRWMPSRFAILTGASASAGAQEHTPLILGWGTYVAPHDGPMMGRTTACRRQPIAAPIRRVGAWLRCIESGTVAWLNLTLELKNSPRQARRAASRHAQQGLPTSGTRRLRCGARSSRTSKHVETDEVSIGGGVVTATRASSAEARLWISPIMWLAR